MSGSFGRRTGIAAAIVTVCTVTIAALPSVGCRRGSAANAPAQPEVALRPAPRTAEDVLKRVEEVYHKADRYQDAGRLVLQYTLDGTTYNQTSEFSLALAGPNRLRMRVRDALVVCDGQTFRATIDEAPDEMLSMAAPEELSPGLVYSDPVLGRALNEIVGSVPLSLFLDPEPIPGLRYNAQTPQLDTPQAIEDHNCYRVRIPRREGALVLWIDEKSFVVRRVEYPSEGYRQLVEPSPGAVSSMTITAELDDARLDPPIDDSVFQMTIPKGVELVRRFDAVLVGARIPRFKLHALDGRIITRESLAGKIAVIKFWQRDEVGTYREDLETFEQVQKRFKDQDSVVFLAVTTDPEEISDEDLRAALAAADISLQIARLDLKAAYRSFGLQYLPTTVILGPDGTLQEHTIGDYPSQAQTLPKKLDTLLAGGDLVLEVPDKIPEYTYYGAFAWQNPLESEDDQKSAAATALAKAHIAPPTAPESLRLKRLWACSELEQPGNMLVARDDSGNDQVFVLDGSNVAQIGADGKVLVTYPLDLPGRDAGVTFLRTAVDAAGKRFFVGSEIGAKQVHLFDANWKRILSFPDDDGHPGIADATLADIDGDGQLEMLVGYTASVGVHCVSLDGERLWRNRMPDRVLRLAVSGASRRGRRDVLVAQGILLLIDADGGDRAPIVFPKDFVRSIFTADAHPNWCAIAVRSVESGQPVRDVAIGLSPRGDELWRYPLPEGMQHHPAFETVVVGDLLGQESGQWVLAGADGSIHILGDDGIPVDHFNYGAAPTGMAIAHLNGRPTLLVASDETVEAWQFTLPGKDETD
ncbi:MAG TPA: redoxin domain-containing protein [Pirellulales bacterium]|nr:redoxin domain-containing protein [Pirellulales bacterium]